MSKDGMSKDELRCRTKMSPMHVTLKAGVNELFNKGKLKDDL